MLGARGSPRGGLVHVAGGGRAGPARRCSPRRRRAFTIVKLVGAVYLDRDRHPPPARAATRTRWSPRWRRRPARRGRLFVQGAVVNVAEPEDGAVLPRLPAAVRRPDRGRRGSRSRSSAWRSSLLAVLSDSAYALAAAALAGQLRASERARRIRRCVTGGVFVVLGATAATAKPHVYPVRGPAPPGLADRASSTCPTTASCCGRRRPRVEIEDVGAAVREALRFPLAGAPLAAARDAATARATVVIEVPTLPIPTATPDPRHEAISATVDELERLGVAARRRSSSRAGSCGGRRRARSGCSSRRSSAGASAGRVIVHDAEAEDLVEIGTAGSVPLRVSRALVETDLIVTVTAAETVLHGGPAALLKACGREALRADGRDVAARARHLAGLGPRARARAAARGARCRCSACRSCSTCRTSSAATRTRSRSSSGSRPRALRRGFALVPGRRCARRIVERVPRELTAAAVFGGTPSSAHAEALLRAIEFKGAALDEPLDAIVIGIPPHDALPPALAAEPRRGRASRARPRAAPVAERVPGARGRHGDPAARLPAPLRRADADAVPRALLATRAPRATARPSARPSARPPPTRAASPSTAPGAPCHPLEPFVAWSACDAVGQPARQRARRRLPRRRSGAAARLRPGRAASAPPSAWRAAAARSASASCSRRRTSRCVGRGDGGSRTEGARDGAISPRYVLRTCSFVSQRRRPSSASAMRPVSST